MQERIQKIIARCGIASRRKAEEMIQQGRVTVNGAPASLGMKADFAKDHIKVNGKLIRRSEPKTYIALHKPGGYITSVRDPQGRPTVKDLLKGVKARVFPVGRLDYESEGLVLMTNDGELTHALLHPGRKIPRTYLVKIDGILENSDIQRLQAGIKLEDGVTAPARVRKIRKTEACSWLEITLYEGRKRQIRRMLQRLDHSVLRLRRVRINGLALGKLPKGRFRHLTSEEVMRVKKETMQTRGRA